MSNTFLPLELGKTYETRNGNKVTIEYIDYEYSYPFFGRVVTKEEEHLRVASFNAGGGYKHGVQSEFDIIGLFQY